MGGDDTRQNPNVIIPDTGAGKYWYVDPRAGNPQQPQQYGQSAQPDVSHPSIEIMKAVQRLINPNPDEQVARSNAMAMMSGQQYDPMDAVRQKEAYRKQIDEQYHVMGPKDVDKTISMEIHGKEWEVPAVFDNMTESERNIIHYLPHTQWPKDILNKIENTARDNLNQGNDPFGNSITPNKPLSFGF